MKSNLFADTRLFGTGTGAENPDVLIFALEISIFISILASPISTSLTRFP